MNKYNSQALLVFPHQLFEQNPLLEYDAPFFIIEEPLYFSQYKFHKHKLVYHRSSMKFYTDFLSKKGCQVNYVSYHEKTADVRHLIPHLKTLGFSKIHTLQTEDNYLQRRLKQTAQKENILLESTPSPSFLNTQSELSSFFKANKKKFFHTSFYIDQRQKRQLLLSESKGPLGGKWSFDVDNRKKYPKDKTPPPIPTVASDSYFYEAVEYIDQHFADNPGDLPTQPLYPHSHEEAKHWLTAFLDQRFADFGVYEDAIVQGQHFLNHSVLSPMLNNGLITPQEVIDECITYVDSVPLNSLEGFVRQIIGWREFIRGIYHVKGSQERTTNYFGYHRKIPPSFYSGDTGILPLDDVIKKVNKTAYAHHIERLMVVGNFMLLCEFHPDEVYRWFMELFIDAYDWVMVPNVYGMSQFADGGLMATKPYISSSNYIKKMSNYPNGEWQRIWDALYWRFVDQNRPIFIKNIRMKFMITLLDKMPTEKKEIHMSVAENFLNSLDF